MPYKPKSFLSKENPELLKEWDYEKNIEDPNKISTGNSKKVWWKCSRGHSWQTRVSHRTAGRNCPHCHNENRPKNFKDSFLAKYPEKAKEWHPTKNGNLTPDQVLQGSNRNVWWLCLTDNRHEYQQPIERHRKIGCPYCKNKRIDITNCLATTRPDLASEWHPTKNILTPYNVVRGTDKKVWWICQKGHEWEAIIYNRQEHGCPFCSNQKVDSTNSLLAKFPEIAKQWNYEKNHPVKPSEILAGSDKKFWWVCTNTKDHTWKAAVCSRTTKTKATNCPICHDSTGEKKIVKYFDNKKINYKREYVIPECRNKKPLWFDFVVLDKENKVSFLIEYNGKQHYQDVEYFGRAASFKIRQENDLIKVKYCKNNNIDLLIIPYTEIKNIETILETKIKNLPNLV